MDLFGETIITKGQFQRAALSFGKIATQKIGSQEHRQLAIEEDDRFKATDAGRWNYKDLYSALIEVAKGGNPDDAIVEFEKLKGNGEAISKVTLFREIVKSTSIVEGAFIDASPVVIDLGGNVKLPLKYDVRYRYNDTIYCVLILPRAEPFKKKALSAISAEFSMPFPGMIEKHKLILIENPKINGKRSPKTRIYDFNYKEVDTDFREHLRISTHIMTNDHG